MKHIFRFPEKRSITACVLKVLCYLHSTMYNIESHEPVVQTLTENVLYPICTFVWEHERLVSLLISRADSCCLIAGVWKDRWPLWEREERVLRVEEDLSISPSHCQHRQSWNTAPPLSRTAYIRNISPWVTRAHLPYGFVHLLPLSAHKKIKELRFYVHSQDNWKWWLNLWWPWCVENASSFIFYAVVSLPWGNILSGTETF